MNTWYNLSQFIKKNIDIRNKNSSEFTEEDEYFIKNYPFEMAKAFVKDDIHMALIVSEIILNQQKLNEKIKELSQKEF